MIRKSILRHEIPSLIARASFLPIERTESNDFLFNNEDDDDFSDEESSDESDLDDGAMWGEGIQARFDEMRIESDTYDSDEEWEDEE
jgi:hypothetical protein